MNKATKTFPNASEAKSAFNNIFGVGPYSSAGTYCDISSISGSLDGPVITLKSNYWVESSLERILEEETLQA